MPRLQPPGRTALVAEDTPRPPSPADIPHLPDLPANSPFFLRHFPTGWQVMAGRVVPILKVFRIEPGLGGVDKSGAYHMAKAAQEARGWTFVPHDVDGPGTTYCKRYKVAQGYHHTEPFARVYPGTSVVECDQEAYADWLEGLVERGIIKPPPPYVLRKIIDDLTTRRENAADRAKHIPSAADDVERITAQLEILSAKLAEVEGPKVPLKAEDAPKPRRGRRKESSDGEA